MPLELTAIMIGVKDLARSKKFYGEGLGCTIDQDHPNFVSFNLDEGSSSLALLEREAAALPLHELAGSMVLGDTLSRSGLTRLLDRMERSGLIRRRLNRHDRRRFDASITARGRARFEAVWPEHVVGIRRYFSDPLADRDIVNLQTALTKLIRANQDHTDV